MSMRKLIEALEEGKDGVDYWRTVSGSKLGFSGTPGSGKLEVGNPKALTGFSDKGGSGSSGSAIAPVKGKAKSKSVDEKSWKDIASKIAGGSSQYDASKWNGKNRGKQRKGLIELLSGIEGDENAKKMVSVLDKADFDIDDLQYDRNPETDRDDFSKPSRLRFTIEDSNRQKATGTLEFNYKTGKAKLISNKSAMKLGAEYDGKPLPRRGNKDTSWGKEPKKTSGWE